MTYEKVWKEQKKKLEQDLAFLKDEIENQTGKEMVRIKAKYEAMSIIYHRILEAEEVYPLEEKEQERQRKKDLE